MTENEDVEVLDLEDTQSINKIEPQPANTNVISTSETVETEQKNINDSLKSETTESGQEITNETPEYKTVGQSASNNLPKYDGYRNKIIRYSIFLILSILLLSITGTLYYKLKNSTSSYTENATASYQVCLKKNDYYKDKCLTEGLEYVAEITDNINVDFNYSAVYQTKQSKKYKYYIESKIKFQTTDNDERELLTTTKKLTDKKDASINGNVLSIAESVEVPFKKNDEYARQYKSDYSLLSNVDLIVSLVLQDKDSKKELSSVVIPLSKLTYSISKKEINNQPTEYKLETNPIIGTFLLIGIIISIIFIILSTIKIVKFLWKTRNKKSTYEKKLKQILNTYDRVIITLEDKNTITNDQEVYKVKTFLELLDVRDTIDKPILYYKVNDIKTEFYVQDINKTYKFTMKESDFEDK